MTWQNHKIYLEMNAILAVQQSQTNTVETCLVRENLMLKRESSFSPRPSSHLDILLCKGSAVNLHRWNVDTLSCLQLATTDLECMAWWPHSRWSKTLTKIRRKEIYIHPWKEETCTVHVYTFIYIYVLSYIAPIVSIPLCVAFRLVCSWPEKMTIKAPLKHKGQRSQLKIFRIHLHVPFVSRILSPFFPTYKTPKATHVSSDFVHDSLGFPSCFFQEIYLGSKPWHYLDLELTLWNLLSDLDFHNAIFQ